MNKVTGDYVITIDNDFQNPVSEVLKLGNTASGNDNDVVYPVRKKAPSFGRGKKYITRVRFSAIGGSAFGGKASLELSNGVYSYHEKKSHSLFRNLGSWFNPKTAINHRGPRKIVNI